MSATSTPQYQLICGQYVLHQDGKPVSAPLTLVALAYSLSTGELLRHGNPKSVASWVQRFRQHMDMAIARLPTQAPKDEILAKRDDVEMLAGRFTLEDLNRCLSTPSYAGELARRADEGTLRSLDLAGNPNPLPGESQAPDLRTLPGSTTLQ